VLLVSLLLVAVIFLAPLPVFAANNTDNTGEGLVPCGTRSSGRMCTFSDIYHLAKNIMDFLLFTFAVPTAAGLFTWAGILYVYSAWDPGQRNKAKKILQVTLWGLIIAFAGWLIVTTILKVLTTNGSIQPA
jgi:hypothetical protein